MPNFLSQKPRVLNPKYYTHEMELEDQGYKEIICKKCNRKVIIDRDFLEILCDKCK